MGIASRETRLAYELPFSHALLTFVVLLAQGSTGVTQDTRQKLFSPKVAKKIFTYFRHWLQFMDRPVAEILQGDRFWLEYGADRPN